MPTPINEFIKAYAESGTVRFHMPGHKGRAFHSCEALDITEIAEADYLFEPTGIIKQSEEQMAAAFGTARTFYSTEGSSLCIKAMLGIIAQCRKTGGRLKVIAPRNVHKAFINACILLDIEVFWLYPRNAPRSLCEGRVTADEISAALDNFSADCVYITSPDYLGFISDVKGIAAACHSHGVPLICDNAHGAYLNFLEPSQHPIALGADMCCDSAHKTLPCYTGAALLHISKNADSQYLNCAKNVMSLFASTSPSYLIMQSLDLCSEYLLTTYREDLAKTAERTRLCKERLQSLGWRLTGDEECKITVEAYKSGLTGNGLANSLRAYNIEPEYSDSAYLVLMVSTFNTEEDFAALEKAMALIPQNAEKAFTPDTVPPAKAAMAIREAAFSKSTEINIDEADGRICGLTVTSCQPSVPVVVSGEIINGEIIKILKKYGILSVNVL